MDITPEIEALKILFKSINLSDRADSLTKYAAIRVITNRLLEEIETTPEDEKPQMARYVSEKLSTFAQRVEWAVMPGQATQKSPEQWMESAWDNLSVADSKS